MAKYRDRLEVTVDILNAAKEGAKKTRIMYVANLSYTLLEKYLKETAKLGFVCVKDNVYSTTRKGLAFLEKYNNAYSRFSRIEAAWRRALEERNSLERLCEISGKKKNLSVTRKKEST